MPHSLFYPLTYETFVACEFFPYLTSTSSRATHSIFNFFWYNILGICPFCLFVVCFVLIATIQFRSLLTHTWTFLKTIQNYFFHYNHLESFGREIPTILMGLFPAIRLSGSLVKKVYITVIRDLDVYVSVNSLRVGSCPPVYHLNPSHLPCQAYAVC